MFSQHLYQFEEVGLLDVGGLRQFLFDLLKEFLPVAEAVRARVRRLAEVDYAGLCRLPRNCVRYRQLHSYINYIKMCRQKWLG